ncbi:MAG TPA: ATP-binding protein [Holophagaceae bacterium]|nr:ATP-binding protein [Holophagaceae bacterium]
MRRLADFSIRAKLRGIVALTTILALLVSGLAMVVHDSLAFRKQKLDDLITQAQILGSISGAALTFDDPKAAQEYLATLKARPDIEEAALYDARGRVFASYARSSTLDAPSLAEAQGYRFEGDRLTLFQRMQEGGETSGTIYLRASLGKSARLRRYLAIVLLAGLGALGIALLLSAWLQRVITEPLLDVTEVARGVLERQDYSQRVVKRSEDEVGVLVEAFNGMLAAIQHREAALQEANEALHAEIVEHRGAREEVDALNQDLERRVMERTAELETANKELESFSYSVSHDLRAPLRAIDGFASLLVKHQSDRLDAQGQGYLERVRAATQRMGQLIDDLLRLSRTTRSEMSRRDLDLSELARAVVVELQVGSPERRVSVSVAPGLKANADFTLMRTVLENLLGNAWKFTAKKDEARIEFGRLEQAGDTVFFVRDNGAGFDMRYADKLFGAFQRLHAVTEYSGTGVGLANVQRIIHRHGGRIWAEAEPGRGAAFYFTLSHGGRA